MQLATIQARIGFAPNLPVGFSSKNLSYSRHILACNLFFRPKPHTYAAGMAEKGTDSFGLPASTTRTCTRGSSARRAATTHPAVPPLQASVSSICKRSHVLYFPANNVVVARREIALLGHLIQSPKSSQIVRLWIGQPKRL